LAQGGFFDTRSTLRKRLPERQPIRMRNGLAAAVWCSLLWCRATATAACPKQTSGTCWIWECHESRNAVCEGHGCICGQGYCSYDGDACVAAPVTTTEAVTTTTAAATNYGDCDMTAMTRYVGHATDPDSSFSKRVQQCTSSDGRHTMVPTCARMICGAMVVIDKYPGCEALQRRGLSNLGCSLPSADATITDNLLATPGGDPTFPVEGIELAEGADRLHKDNNQSRTSALAIAGAGAAAGGISVLGVAALLSRRSAVRQAPLLG